MGVLHAGDHVVLKVSQATLLEVICFIHPAPMNLMRNDGALQKFFSNFQIF